MIRSDLTADRDISIKSVNGGKYTRSTFTSCPSLIRQNQTSLHLDLKHEDLPRYPPPTPETPAPQRSAQPLDTYIAILPRTAQARADLIETTGQPPQTRNSTAALQRPLTQGQSDGFMRRPYCYLPPHYHLDGGTGGKKLSRHGCGGATRQRPNAGTRLVGSPGT